MVKGNKPSIYVFSFLIDFQYFNFKNINSNLPVKEMKRKIFCILTNTHTN